MIHRLHFAYVGICCRNHRIPESRVSPVDLSVQLPRLVLRAGPEIRKFAIQANDRGPEFTHEPMDRYWIRQRTTLTIH